MGTTEQELEDWLKDVGTRLSSPPSAVDELLRLLDQTEIYLTRVEQSPSTSMSDALRPAMNSLITKELLNHPEIDVKVFVAACINEITRITAPEAPYSDSMMKEIFAVIVDTFGNLDDISGPSYSKRVSILETVAKVRSCVVMLDLECDDLILQMFKHFLKNIRPDHSINVFSSMETIMTLVLEDSEDVSKELLHCLLSNLQKSKKDVLPVSRMLAEKVIRNCAMKLKPYLLAAVKSEGTFLSDYEDIVASICQECSATPRHTEVDESKSFERTVSDELPQESQKLDKPTLEQFDTLTEKTSKMPSNGVMPFGNENSIVEPISADIAPRGEINKLGFITEKTGNELDLNNVEAKSSSVQLTDASDSSRVGDKEASPPTIKRAGRKRKTKSMKSDGTSNVVLETQVLLKPNLDVDSPIEGPIGDSKFAPAVASDNLHGSGLSKMDHAARSQFSAKRSTTLKTVLSAGKKKKSRNTKKEEGSLDIVSELKEDHYEFVSLDGRPSHDSPKSLEDIATTVDVTEAVVSGGKSLGKEQNKASQKVSVASSSQKQRKASFKEQNDKDASEGGKSAEQRLKEKIVSSKDSLDANNDENTFIKSVEANSSKKRQRKASGWKIYTGRKIEVWWPDDQMFYKGVIDQFDPVTEKHKVLYDDGDVEFLLLRNERWNYIDSNIHDKGQKNDYASPEPLQTPKKPRESSGKSKATPERDKSVGEFKDTPIQQSHGGKSAAKARGRPKQETPKAAISSEEKTQGTYVNEGTKVEDSHGRKPVVRSRGRPKQETPMIATSPDEKTQGTNGNDGSIIEESLGGKSAARSRGRRRQETPKSATSPDEKSLGTYHNDGTKVKESQGGKLVIKSKGRFKQEISKVGTSPNEKAQVMSGSDVPKVEESPQMNSPSGFGKSVTRSRRRPKGDNNQETKTETPQTKVSDYDTSQDTGVVKDDIIAVAKVEERSIGNRPERSRGRGRRRGRGRGRNSALKSGGKPKTSNISTQTDIPDDLPADTPGSFIRAKQGTFNTNEKLEDNYALELNNMSGEASKARGKRKETAAAVTVGTNDANLSAIKTSEGKLGESIEGSKARGKRKGTPVIIDANNSASSQGAKSRLKRKETAATTAADGISSEGKEGDASAIQSDAGRSRRSAMKPNKRRRK